MTYFIYILFRHHDHKISDTEKLKNDQLKNTTTIVFYIEDINQRIL